MSKPTEMCTFCGQMFLPGTHHAYIVLTVLPALVKTKHTQLLVTKDQVKEILCCSNCFDELPALTAPAQTNT